MESYKRLAAFLRANLRTTCMKLKFISNKCIIKHIHRGKRKVSDILTLNPTWISGQFHLCTAQQYRSSTTYVFN